MRLRVFAAGAAMVLGFVSDLGSVAHAGEPPQICFHDVREFESVRARLPSQLQTGSVYAIHKSFTMRGGFRVFQAGSRFVLEAKGKTVLGQRLNEDQNLKLTCLQGNKLQVWLEDGRYDEMTIVPGGFKFHGYSFRQVSERDYLRFQR